jgi:hypothetical protein
MIPTTKGEMEESDLQKVTGTLDNDNEASSFVEYWLGGSLSCWHHTNGDGSPMCRCGSEQVHRSGVVNHKKPMVFSETGIASFK